MRVRSESLSRQTVGRHNGSLWLGAMPPWGEGYLSAGGALTPVVAEEFPGIGAGLLLADVPMVAKLLWSSVTTTPFVRGLSLLSVEVLAVVVAVWGVFLPRPLL